MLCILNVTHQGAAHDVASVHFCPSIRRTDILVNNWWWWTSNG